MDGTVECTMCKTCWKTVEEFLNDSDLTFNGYQPCYKDPGRGCFLFSHIKDNCGTTLLVEVRKFKALLGDRVDFLPFEAGVHAGCDLKCLQESDLSPCASESCNGTVVRNLIQLVKQYIKTPSKPSLSKDEIDKIINEDAA